MNNHIRRLGLALMVMFSALLIQLTNLQFLKADELASDPRNTRVSEKEFNRPRGLILSADDVVLARSVEKDGIFVRQREYPEGELFGHVTGYLSFTYGTDGVEEEYNDQLVGRVTRLQNARKFLTERDYTENVKLTMTKSLQQLAASALAGRRGSVVALDPRDGSILAMYSNPSYDPSPLAGYDQDSVRDAYERLDGAPFKPMLARTFRETFAPGSTFKVITAAAALERATDLVTKRYPSLSSLDLPLTTRNLRNFGGGTCGGTLPLLLQVSCNTGFAQMGIDLGGERLGPEAEDFGFNQRPPFDVVGSAASSFPDASAFDRNTPALAFSAIGQQDVRATPLQMALVAAGVGNGGVIMKPHVMKEIRDDEGNVVQRSRGEIWKRAMSAESAAALRDMMINVVRRGTATRAAVPGAQVAAKTGTAQTTPGRVHTWITAFAPAEAPRVAVAVIIEDQSGVGSEFTGGRLAAPIAQQILQAALAQNP